MGNRRPEIGCSKLYVHGRSKETATKDEKGRGELWNGIAQKKVKSSVEKLFEEEMGRRRGRKNKNGRCTEGNEREELKKTNTF